MRLAQTKSKRPAAPPVPKGQSYMLVMMLLMLLIMADPSISAALGMGMGFLLNPSIGFGGHLPVLSILCAGLITGLISTGLRHWSTDYIALERGRVLQRLFNKEMMDARAKRDDDRVARMRRAQPFMMSHTMSAQYATMKPAVGTMVIALAVYGWMNLFLRAGPGHVQTTSISLPWTVAWALPPGSLQMMFLYAIMSLPVTLVASHALKLWRFSKFDPNAELPPVPTVADLIARAEGDISDEKVVAKESERARRRLKGAAGRVDEEEEDAEAIEEADEGDIEIVDPDEESEEEDEGANDDEDEADPKAAGPSKSAGKGAVMAHLADPGARSARASEEE